MKNTNTKMSRLTIQIPQVKHREIKILASAKGESMTEYILESLELQKKAQDGDVTGSIIEGLKNVYDIESGKKRGRKAKDFLNGL